MKRFLISIVVLLGLSAAIVHTQNYGFGTITVNGIQPVVASSPGLGIAHFAGGTQTATSSAVNLAGADVTGVLPPANGGTGSSNFNILPLAERRQTILNVDGTSNAFQLSGEPTPGTTLGGGSANSKSPTSTYGPGIFITTTTGSQGIGFIGTKNYLTGRNIWFYTLGWLNTLTTERAWFGITDQTLATMSASDNPAGNYAAFRYSTLGSDSFWTCVTKDNTTQTVVATTVVPTSNATQNFAIIFNDSVPNVVFYINGVSVCTITTHLPTTATAVTWTLNSFNTASGSFQNGVDVEQIHVQVDF